MWNCAEEEEERSDTLGPLEGILECYIRERGRTKLYKWYLDEQQFVKSYRYYLGRTGKQNKNYVLCRRGRKDDEEDTL